MKPIGKKITEQLKAICKELQVSVYDIHVDLSPIDGTFDNIEDIKRLLSHPTGLLIKDGRPFFLYIRDHSVGDFNTTDEYNKVHFTDCRKLHSMKKVGRFNRYQYTTRTDNKYLIDISGRKTEESLLYPCQFCLEKSNYKNFANMRYFSRSRRKIIVENFDAKEGMDYMEDLFLHYADQLRHASIYSGYPDDFCHISYKYRSSKKFTCEKCRVRLDKFTKLTDCHHKGFVKSDTDSNKLECLCKLCHADIHPHYKHKVSDNDANIIIEQRRIQNLKNVKTKTDE